MCCVFEKFAFLHTWVCFVVSGWRVDRYDKCMGLAWKQTDNVDMLVATITG